ncbi:MAG: hypothetical protein ACYCWW_07895 [Deltaproteobacteria bacterium]
MAGIARAGSADGNAALTRVAIGVATGRMSLCEAISAADEVVKQEPALVRATLDRDSYRAQLYAAAKRQLRTGQTAIQIDRVIGELRCLGSYRDAAHLMAEVSTLRVSLARSEEKQSACARDRACTAATVATEICTDLADRRDVEAGLAEQRRLAREAGAIDLDELAERADALEAIDARVGAEEARYRAIAGRPFDRRTCRAQMASRAH